MFADTLVSEHPNRNNMLGLKQMLEVYGIKSEGVLYKDKLHAEMVFPCILHISGAFVVGKDIRGDSITYLYEGKERTKPVRSMQSARKNKYETHKTFEDLKT